ncbi:MAG: hypothetical protein AAF693_12830 [Bacteroidota bacterium]
MKRFIQVTRPGEEPGGSVLVSGFGTSVFNGSGTGTIAKEDGSGVLTTGICA